MEWRNEDGYTISTDPEGVDRRAVWEFLRTSYWAAGVAYEVVDRSIDNSLVFGLTDPHGAQAGFARAVTDRARFAWLADVFVLPPHRGQGLGVWLVQTIVTHPDLVGVRFLLGTKDAHSLYARFGFAPVEPGRILDRSAVRADPLHP